MNSRLNFRAWTGDKMIDDVGVDAGAMPSHRLYGQHPEWVIMQSTGVTDKNDREIFEGDICKTQNGKIVVVEWWDERFKFTFRGRGFTLTYKGVENCEIIGNVFENPELEE